MARKGKDTGNLNPRLTKETQAGSYIFIIKTNLYHFKLVQTWNIR
jgi:hypothetical protein